MASTRIFIIGDTVCVEVRGPEYVEGGFYERDDRRWFTPKGVIKSRRLMRVDAKRLVMLRAAWVFD